MAKRTKKEIVENDKELRKIQGLISELADLTRLVAPEAAAALECEVATIRREVEEELRASDVSSEDSTLGV